MNDLYKIYVVETDPSNGNEDDSETGIKAYLETDITLYNGQRVYVSLDNNTKFATVQSSFSTTHDYKKLGRRFCQLMMIEPWSVNERRKNYQRQLRNVQDLIDERIQKFQVEKLEGLIADSDPEFAELIQERDRLKKMI